MTESEEHPEDAAEKGDKEPRHPAAVINDLVRLVGKLGEYSAFRQSDMGLTEWCFLRMVAQSEGQGAGRVASRLGISPQRSAQVVNALVSAKYVVSSPSGADGRRRNLTITEQGRSTAEAMDRQVEQLFQSAFSDVPKTMRGMSRNLRRILKAITPSEQKQKKKDQK